MNINCLSHISQLTSQSRPLRHDVKDVDVKDYLWQCGHQKPLDFKADNQLLYDIFTYLNNIPYFDCIIHAVSKKGSNLDVVCIYEGLSTVISWLDTGVLVCQLFPALAVGHSNCYFLKYDISVETALVHSISDKIYTSFLQIEEDVGLNTRWINVMHPVLELIVRAKHFINMRTAKEPFNLTTYLSPGTVAVPGVWKLPYGPASVNLSPDFLLLWEFHISLDSLGDFLTDPARAGTCFIEHDIYYSQLTELWMDAHEQFSSEGNLYVHILFIIYLLT